MAKKHVCPEPEVDTSGEWLASYGDLVTLLMAFFVMLFAMSTTDVVKFQALMRGLAGPFNNAAAMALVEGVQGGSIADVTQYPSATSSKDDGKGTGPTESGQGAGILDSQKQIEVLEQDVDKKVDELKDEGLLDAESSNVRDDSRGLVINLSTDDVLFKSGSAILTERGHQIIAQLAPTLAASPNTIVVEGHTDNDPYPSDKYDNWNLAADRSVAVVRSLVANGFPARRLSATSYGEFRPSVPNDSPENKAINRRVEILIVSLSESQAAGEANPIADQQGAEVTNPIGSPVTIPNIKPDISPHVDPGINPNPQPKPEQPKPEQDK